jgi:vancomycin permeability regulator SanA
MVRGVVFASHVAVMALALASLLTGRFQAWIDLRNLGPLAAVVEMVWAGCALATPLAAGPWLSGLRNPRWTQHGLSVKWALRLLWPTYFVLACLTANLTYYVKLALAGDADWMIPAPLLAAVLLAVWTLFTREWLRRRERLPATAPAWRWLPICTAALAALALFIPTASLAMENYARAPTGPVDLAVVLGAGTREDDTASTELEDRVRTAIALYRRGDVKHIMLSGAIYEPAKPGNRRQDEIAAMLKVCNDAGVPEDAITLDPVGVNTRATAFNAIKLMREHGWTSVVACSTDYHLRRIHMSFMEYGVDCYALPSLRQPAQHAARALRAGRLRRRSPLPRTERRTDATGKPARGRAQIAGRSRTF